MSDYLPPPTTLPSGSTLWTYLRDSGGPMQDRSVAQQKAEVLAFCERYGLNLTLIFADEARSGGTVVGREHFNEMIDLSSKHESSLPDGLLIWNYARFARDLDDSQFYKSVLRKRGFVIHSMTDPIPEGPYGQIVEIIIDIANQEKKRQVSRDARRGLQDLVTVFGCVPGNPPAGFMRQPMEIGLRRDGSVRTAARWVPDPAMIVRIQTAFKMRVSGSSLADINAETRLFTSLTSYQTFWANKIYIGTLVYGTLTIENYCKPMIDLATWTNCQIISARYTQRAQLKSVADHPRRVGSKHLLSGLIRCGRCGSPLWAHTTKKKNGDIQSYRCTRGSRRRDCDLPHLPAYSLEQGIINKLSEILRDPDYYTQSYRALQRRQTQRLEELEQKRIGLQSDLTAVRNKMNNITAAIADRGHSRPLLDRLEALEAEQTELKTALIEIKTAQETPLQNLSDEQLQAYALHMADLITTADPHARRVILQGLVSEIRMDRHDDQLTGEMVIYMDTEDEATPPENPPDAPGGMKLKGMPTHHGPLVAPSFTHTVAIQIQIRRKPSSRR